MLFVYIKKNSLVIFSDSKVWKNNESETYMSKMFSIYFGN